VQIVTQGRRTSTLRQQEAAVQAQNVTIHTFDNQYTMVLDYNKLRNITNTRNKHLWQTTRAAEPLSRLTGAAQRTTPRWLRCMQQQTRAELRPRSPGGPARTRGTLPDLEKDNQPQFFAPSCLCRLCRTEYVPRATGPDTLQRPHVTVYPNYRIAIMIPNWHTAIWQKSYSQMSHPKKLWVNRLISYYASKSKAIPVTGHGCL
jgi:hypothetical protein